MHKIKRIFFFIKKYGALSFINECIDKMIDAYYEARFNINTKGYVLKESLENQHPDWIDYGAINYRHIIMVLNNLKIDANTSTILDYGSGKGRVLSYAASCNYKKIIGVENSKFLMEIAKENINKMNHRKTKDIIFEECNAENYEIPSSVNIIYFYNPFIGLTLEKVIKNIILSYKESPRKISIVFWNDAEFKKIISKYKLIKLMSSSHPHPFYSCGVYQIE